MGGGMSTLKQTTLGLWALSVLMIVVVVGGYVFHLATFQPSLYTPPPEAATRSNVQMVREATNLEGLRKVCEIWAASEDRSQAFLSFQVRTFDQMMKILAVGLLLLGTVFSVGLGYIYARLRRLELGTPNAL